MQVALKVFSYKEGLAIISVLEFRDIWVVFCSLLLFVPPQKVYIPIF